MFKNKKMKKKSLNLLITTLLLGNTVFSSVFVFAEETTSDTFNHEPEQSLESETPSDFNEQSVFITNQEVNVETEKENLPIDQDDWLYEEYEKFITISNDSYSFWDNLEWEEERSTTDYLNKTFKTTAEYQNREGDTYLSLYDHQDQWLGYLNKNATTLAAGAQGIHQSYEKFVTIRNDLHLFWDGFEWENGSPTTDYQNKTFKTSAKYEHFSGDTYLSLYDHQNQWLGYLNENATTLASGAQGIHQSYERFVTIRNDLHLFWDGFEWENGSPTTDYLNKTFKTSAKYEHFSGDTYLSLYDHQNQWLGYLNENATSLAVGAQGIHQSYERFVTIRNDLHLFWDGFEWENGSPATGYQNKTFKTTAKYEHFSGDTYLSLYDHQNQWLGYLNENATSVVQGKQGKYQDYGEYVTVKSNAYSIWRNFSWTAKASGSFSGKTYLAKGVYNHFNGSRYFSLYDRNDKWIGYINEDGTRPSASQADKFEKVQDLLNREYRNNNFGIYVMSLSDGSVAQMNGHTQFHAASTGKLPVMYYTQKMILENKVNGDHLYTYTDAINQMPNSYMRGGAGILQGQSYGKKFSLNTVMNWTAKYSDNQGTNFLGYYAANGYDGTMKKEISSIMGRDWKSPFYVNAKDNAMMLEAIYYQGGKLITDMSNTIFDNQRIPKYIPVQVAHKIGDVYDLRHDAGIIYSDEPYALSILTKNSQSYEQISLLSKKIYDILK